MSRIVSLGSALQDVFLIDRDDFAATEIGDTSIFGHIEIGSKIDIDKIHFTIGGGGTNAATTFARYGHESIYMGNIGRDAPGRAVLDLLDKEGIDNSYVSYVKGKNTGYSVILLDARSGERTILTCRGASSHYDNLDAKDLDNISPDWLYITTVRGDMGTLDRFITKAKKLGAKVAMNPGKMEIKESKKLMGLLSDIDILIVNRKEACEIMPGAVLLEELLSRLSNIVNTVIITDSGNGGIAKSGKTIYRFGLYRDVKVRDTTGAGDAFGSGFLAAHARGKSFHDSLVFASANSTSVVQQLGAKKGILTGTEKLKIMPIQEIR